jgi:hypothetical protein
VVKDVESQAQRTAVAARSFESRRLRAAAIGEVEDIMEIEGIEVVLPEEAVVVP